MLACLLSACSPKLVVGHDPADASARDSKTNDAGDVGDGDDDGNADDGGDRDTDPTPVDASSSLGTPDAAEEDPTVGESECNRKGGQCLRSGEGPNDPGAVNPCLGPGLVLTNFTCQGSDDALYACCIDECNSKGGHCLYSGKGPNDPSAINPCIGTGVVLTNFTCQAPDNALYACCVDSP
jgi:hypothetical protein